ncbi:hypothetical protein BDQ17DRAFT_1353960 [Cyathus striatus]|nr:hypothetical protein BDQ17DRAFT_1353960 [Cyathus striatus]
MSETSPITRLPQIHTGLPHHFSGRVSKRRLPRSKPPMVPLLGVGDVLGAGDSYLVADLLPPELAHTAFQHLSEQVRWTTMYHRGGEVPREVAVQGQVNQDGSFPVYRHPADESPPLSQYTPVVALIREHVQNVINHPVNHVLIQHYRSGKDYISEHSDKTIDVVRGSSIVNVSLGAQRTMTLRLKKDNTQAVLSAATTGADAEINANEASSPATKTPRSAQRIPLPHNSMFVMGPETNMKWLHGIGHDNRPLYTKSEEEQFQGGARISLTFRYIGTFLSGDEKYIWGQGGKGKTKEDKRLVVNGTKEAERLIEAFGEENQRSEFDWDAAYGQGFDVLHFREVEG